MQTIERRNVSAVIFLPFEHTKGMAYSYKGSISFGLVYIPVTLHSTIKENDIGFNMIDKKTMSRVKYKKTCADCDGREVKQELLLERATLDLMHLQSSKPADPEAFEISVNGKVYTDKKEGGKALMDALYGGKPETVVAEYCGFKISMNLMKSLTGERDITLAANGQYTMALGESTSGNLQRLDNFMEDFPKRKERLENRLQQLKNDLEIAKEQVEKPFEHKVHLAELLSEQAELNAELNLDKREESAVVDDGNGAVENYRALPTQRKSREDKVIDDEDKVIDDEDKVAAMQVDVLPDYEVDTEDMHKYGYVWDGMLPLTRDKAARFWGMGLQVYKLGADNTQQEIEHYGNFGIDTKEKAMFGIEKPHKLEMQRYGKPEYVYVLARAYIKHCARYCAYYRHTQSCEKGVRNHLFVLLYARFNVNASA